MRMGRGIASAVVAIGLAVGAALAGTSAASAHDFLVDSSPAADSVQMAPLHRVSLTFNDIVLDLSHDGSSALLQVTGPGNSTRHFETGCPTIADRVVSAPVALGGPGRYTVAWQIVSADGHTVSDSIAFTYRPPAGTAESAGRASRPTCGEVARTAPSAVPVAPASSSSANLGLVIGMSIGIVVLALAGVAVVVLTAPRRRECGAARFCVARFGAARFGVGWAR
jgi:copper resistance protein C